MNDKIVYASGRANDLHPTRWMRLGLSVNIHCRPMNFDGSTLFALSNVHSADPCGACQLHFFHFIPFVRLGYLTEPMSASAMAFYITLSYSG